jgi:nitrate reductase NapE component
MKPSKSQEGYQNEYLNLAFLVFIVITILSITLLKTWGIIVFCTGCSLLFALLILSYVYDPKRIAENTPQTIKEEEPKGY